MYRCLGSNKGKVLLAIFLLLCIFIFVNRHTNDIVEHSSNVNKKALTKPKSLRTLNGQFTARKAAFKASSDMDFNVFDHKCKIPRPNPFSEDVMSIFEPPKFKECADQPDLFTVQYDLKEKQYILQYNESLLVELVPNISDYGCACHELHRAQDDSLTWNIISPFSCHDWTVPRRVQGIVVECFELRNRSRVLQRDAFSFVQYPVNCNDKSDEERSLTYPSVIMLGIDSMSQMNFQRTMPLTAHFVRQPGWYEMLGHNTISDGPFTNMITLLTGSLPQEWKNYCDIKKPGCLDALTYLWNHYHNAGYQTAYAEDTPTFVLTRQPVDYYLNPIMKAFEKIMAKVKRFQYDYCLGRKPNFRYVFDYCLQLVQRFVHETPKPFFGIFWTKSFSYDDFSGAANVDKDFVSYLEQFKEHGLFERAVVILFSLHGQHKGPLMDLSSSFLEERLPMLHIYLPPWYRKQYPTVGHALDVNRRRLSSTVDLHLTIKALLLQVRPSLRFEKTCQDCKSLLEVIPDKRSCKDAWVQDHWCSCEPYTQEPITESIEILAKTIVYRINQFIFSTNYTMQCYHLELKSVLRAESKINFDFNGLQVPPPDEMERYRIQFTTRPRGKFRGIVLSNVQANVVEMPEAHISRLEPHGSCVQEPLAAKYCVCRPSK
ncbi:uncharacterized protein LOC115763223 [Drosophila novamexicana]|uniref:uncharacterized protein LOC115763223 n=1 Tax=Drosophila novamexicana TaxID=47314 RepID=UPI0011E58D94|nr:uncharacterized protein LOC115763223 [Drosophila novamexicana]